MRLLIPTLLMPVAALAGTGFDGTWKTNMESLKTTGKPSGCGGFRHPKAFVGDCTRH